MEVEERHASKKCRWFRFKLSCCKIGQLNVGFTVRLNPVVSIFSALIIWTFVVWCIVEAKAANEEMTRWRAWITLKFTWLYIGAQDAWALFLIVLYFSKYSKMKLGKADEKPEFSDATYFMMLFTAGMGIGLFYFGVGMFTICSDRNNPGLNLRTTPCTQSLLTEKGAISEYPANFRMPYRTSAPAQSQSIVKCNRVKRVLPQSQNRLY